MNAAAFYCHLTLGLVGVRVQFSLVGHVKRPTLTLTTDILNEPAPEGMFAIRLRLTIKLTSLKRFLCLNLLRYALSQETPLHAPRDNFVTCGCFLLVCFLRNFLSFTKTSYDNIKIFGNCLIVTYSPSCHIKNQLEFPLFVKSQTFPKYQVFLSLFFTLYNL